MKQPKLGDLKIDAKGTARMRREFRRTEKVKITINIAEESLQALRAEAKKTGVPYQVLLNRVLEEGLSRRNLNEDRLSQLEKEVERIKDQLTA